MADYFVWNESEFGLKVHEMDNEHIELIRRMNKLHKAWEAKASFEQIMGYIQDLVNYTVQHFSDEEAFMAKINFEGAAIHKIIHQQLLNQFQTHVEEFKSSKVLSETFFNFLKVWLSGHIKGIDMKYSQAFRKAA